MKIVLMKFQRVLLTLSAILLLNFASNAYAILVPLVTDGPIAVEKLRPNNPAVLPMTGTWKFQIAKGREHGDQFVPELGDVTASGADNDHEATSVKFAQLDFDAQSFSSIPVPANWEIEGYSKPTYDQPDDAVGLYRREMTIPARFAGKQVLWHFDGVFETAEVFINGRRVGFHESGFTAFDIDVTDFIKPGETNLFAVRVCKNSDSVDLDTGDYWALGGIYRDNYLVALPKTHLDDATIVTDLLNDDKDASLKATVAVIGTPGQPVEVSSQLYRFDGAKAQVPEMKQAGVLDQDGKLSVRLSEIVTSPKLWSAEKPNLYYLVTTLSSNGKLIERTQSRFGFRQIEIKGGVLLWNGVAIKCTGTCRHEEWAVSGHALTEAEWQTDATLIKAANINAIRTSHYVDAERFLELCDERGFYVLDEVPFCWADPKKESYRSAYLQRTQEGYARDKNRPCVLAWSMGNESGFGPVNNAGFELIKKLDPTRPAFISGAELKQNSALDMLDFHYPHLDQIKRIIQSEDRLTKPALLTEGPHTIYTTNTMDYDYGVKDFWGQGLLLQWNLIWPADTMLGAFIWEYQDQGLADKFPDQTGVDAEKLRSNNHKGFVDGYRNVKPDYFNVKMVYSPVVVTAREFELTNNRIAVPIENRYSFTDLSELTCNWEAIAGDKVLASGKKTIACAPKKTTTASFAAVAGIDTLRLEFIHPDGRSVYAARLQLKGLKRPAPPATKESIGTAVTFGDSAGQIHAKVGNSELVFDKSSGTLSSWTVAGQRLISGGLILNLGINRAPHRDGGEDSRESLISKEPPQLQNNVMTAKAEGDHLIVVVSSDVSVVESNQPKGTLLQNYRIRPDGQVDVRWKLNWTGSTARVWELGLKIPLASSLDKMHWLHKGLWSEYPADHIGANEGTAGSDALTFRCTKRDLQWLTMSPTEGRYALCLLNDGTPLHSRGRVENSNLFLYASALNAPIEQDLADGMFGDYFVFLRPNTSYSGGFSLRAVAPHP
jgi:beta-galactosidase